MAMPRKRKKPSPPEVSSEVITGLEPTQEEKALQQLEFGTENITELSYWPSKDLVAEEALCEGTLENHRNLYTYFLHQEDDIAICSNFLVARCSKGILCPQHHTVLPYVWQVREKVTGIWNIIDEGAQLALERLYCEPTRTQVIGHFQGSKILIDLTLMTIHDNEMFDRIRRLSTSICSTKEFHTVYKYYYEEKDDVWKEYEPDFVNCIEEGVKHHYDEVFFSNSIHKYSLSLANMFQTNLQTKTIRRMRKRPAFRSPVAMIAKLRALSRPTGCSQNSSEPSSRCFTIDGNYPKTWSVTDSSPNFETKPLICTDNEYLYVYTCFHKTMAESEYIILEISRVQNYFQWDKYTRKKIYMARNLKETTYGCLERYLFHGTSSKNVKDIFHQNFDPRVSGKNATLYGKGSYFAKDASYSHGYSPATPEGHHFMFFAKVLVGRPTLGKSSYTRPPPLDTDCASGFLYDSCVNKFEDPNIFIIFDNDQFYPYFIIKYQKMEDDVLLY